MSYIQRVFRLTHSEVYEMAVSPSVILKEERCLVSLLHNFPDLGIAALCPRRDGADRQPFERWGRSRLLELYGAAVNPHESEEPKSKTRKLENPEGVGGSIGGGESKSSATVCARNSPSAVFKLFPSGVPCS